MLTTHIAAADHEQLHHLLAAGRVRGLKGHRWLVVACDTKIVLQDLASGTARDIPRVLIDSRAPTRLAFLFVHSAYLLGGRTMSGRVCLQWASPSWLPGAYVDPLVLCTLHQLVHGLSVSICC